MGPVKFGVIIQRFVNVDQFAHQTDITKIEKLVISHKSYAPTDSWLDSGYICIIQAIYDLKNRYDCANSSWAWLLYLDFINDHSSARFAVWFCKYFISFGFLLFLLTNMPSLQTQQCTFCNFRMVNRTKTAHFINYDILLEATMTLKMKSERKKIRSNIKFDKPECGVSGLIVVQWSIANQKLFKFNFIISIRKEFGLWYWQIELVAIELDFPLETKVFK